MSVWKFMEVTVYQVKAKFHYAIWFEAGRQPALNQIA